MLKEINERFSQENAEKIQKALDLAEKYHNPRFLEEITKELLELKSDTNTIISALLLQVLKKGKENPEELQKTFGKEAIELAQTALAIQEMPNKASTEQKTEVLRKIMLSMSKDLRIIIISFSDKIISLKENPSKQEATEITEIYSPIAHKLGMNRIKNRLEDLSFEILHPEEFKKLSENLEESREEREKQVEKIKQALKEKLKEARITAEVIGRAKHLHSIWKKMRTKNKRLEEIYDLTAIRIITENVKECYQALGITHELWQPIMSEFKDYIAKPKPNLYQSLHTVIIGPNQRLIEIQIRTKEMHYVAETGIAAHWKYKKEESAGKLEKKISWLKEAIEWTQDSEKAKQFLDSLKLDFFENEIITFTPKGQPIELPEGSTPIDFAFAVHSDIGFKIDKAIVNGKAVPLDYQLKNGETVEIITSEKQHPKRQWLNFVKTSKASNKIRQALQIHYQTKKPEKIKKQTVIKSIRIKSSHDKAIRIAKCCKPVPGDEIIAFLTTKRKISVHRVDCQNVKESEMQKKVEVSWDISGKENFSVSLKIQAIEKPGLLSELLNIFAKSRARVLTANAKNALNKITECNFEIETKNLKELEQIIEKIQNLKAVQTVERI